MIDNNYFSIFNKHPFSVPVTEIERLWLRFQQLGVNDEGMLPLPAMLQHPSFKSDPFARVVIIAFLFL